MSLFGKKKKLISSSSQEIKGVAYPRVELEETLAKKSVVGSFFIEILDLGDMEDWNILSENSAEKFFSQNEEFIKLLNTISEDDLDRLAIIINEFLKLNNLGKMYLIINEEEEKLFIKHINSPFALSLNGLIEEKVCSFLSKFYSKVFSQIFEEEVSFTEIKCYCQGGDGCVFEMVK